MGAGSSAFWTRSMDSIENMAAAIDPFGHGYSKQRTELRQNLIQQFASDASNRDVLDKLLSLRLLVVKNREICYTAQQEYDNVGVEANPTNKESAFRELERLYTIYETGRILKSVRCRLGPVACPLEHHMTKRFPPSKKDKYIEEHHCSLCTRPVKTDVMRYNKFIGVDFGYHCSYCQYNLCKTCSVIYCCWGHEMTLWTNPEALHTCVCCKKEKVQAGYRCVPCSDEYNVDYNICDSCTHTWGRRQVQLVIIERMKKYLDYMDRHAIESSTAMKTSAEHHKKMANNSYDSTLELYNFSNEIKELKIIAMAEVRQTRLTKEILRIRALLKVGWEYSKTALRESSIVEDERIMWVPYNDMYTDNEKVRLQQLEKEHFYEKSQVVRATTKVGCVLGHAAYYYKGVPKLYKERDGATISPSCKICDRLADEGYHCYLCEYDLCMTCSTIYCGECHPMPMWTIPEAAVSCQLCHTDNLTMGYYCSICDVHTCDQCTNRTKRQEMLAHWQREIVRLMQYFHDHRLQSDVAMYYDWRKVLYIVSPALLIETVRELKAGKVIAMTQVKYRPIILNVKKLRQMIIALNKPAHICKTAVVEADKSDNYFFRTKKQANRELKRLGNLLIRNNYLKSMVPRHKSGIACPLGHALEQINTKDIGSDSSEMFDSNDNDAKRSASVPETYSTKRQYDGNIAKSDDKKAQNERLKNDILLAESKLSEREIYEANKIDDTDNVNNESDNNLDSANLLGLGLGEPEENDELEIKVSGSMKGKTDTTGREEGPRSSKSGKKKKNKKISIEQAQREKEEQDAYEMEEDYKNSTEYKTVCDRNGTCRTCSYPIKDCPVAYFCAYCDFAICDLCKVIYCREGHSCQIWTFADAVGNFCNICTTPDITAGYHCTSCNMDICDECTNRDGRLALKQWHERNLKKLVAQLEALPKDVEIVKSLLDRFKADTGKSYLRSMRALLEELKMYQDGYKQALEDCKERDKRKAQERYVLFNTDL